MEVTTGLAILHTGEFTGKPQKLASSLEPNKLPLFEGRNIQEFSEYVMAWEVYNEAFNQPVQQHIKQAATHLRGAALRLWVERKSDPVTWKEYTMFLRTLLGDPPTRLATASIRLKEAKQRDGQSVSAFRKYIDRLEDDIPERSDEERKAWAFLDGLRPELRLEILKENRIISSREQVLRSAERLEKLLKSQSMVEATSYPSISSRLERKSELYGRRSKSRRGPYSKNVTRVAKAKACRRRSNTDLFGRITKPQSLLLAG